MRSFAKVGAALLPWALLAASTTPAFGVELGAPDLGTGRVREAIVQALERRMGSGVTFDVTALVPALAVPIDGPLAVSFEASARLGGPMRFLLSNRSRRARRVVPIGEATAVVHASGSAVRATRDLTHGVVLGAGDVATVDGDLGSVLVRRLPSIDEATGARLLHDVPRGGVVGDTAIAGIPSVRSGERVHVVAREAGIELSSVAIAALSGAVGQIIEIVNPETRRILRARVIGKGEVEVIDGR